MIWALLLLPFLAAAAAFGIRGQAARRALLVGTATAHVGLSALTWRLEPLQTAGEWLAVGALERVFLTITSVLFLAAAVYAAGYLGREAQAPHADSEEGFLFGNAPEATFTGCLLLFLGTMTLVVLSQHFGVLWVAIEATTLASAPLIHFHRHHRSLEATWKYLMICSVGIALALLGNFFLVVSAAGRGGPHVAMTVGELKAFAPLLNTTWLKAAFILLLVGYGTKMGLAPMHTWLPDAHSESPSVVSALLSGALLNCAFLALLRVHLVCGAAGQGSFSRSLLLVFGLVSMGVAAVFLLLQADYKRMLAYSSVEHMGILAFGVGLGGEGLFGALLHAVNHTFAKGMLFLVAGNLLARYRTKSTAEVRGVLRALPVSGVLWTAGFFAITGSPPFGLFLSEFVILRRAFAEERWVAGGLYLGLLALVFVGMASVVLRMAHGPSSAPAAATSERHREPLTAILPPAALGLIVLVLGLYVPGWLADALHQAARSVAGG